VFVSFRNDRNYYYSITGISSSVSSGIFNHKKPPLKATAKVRVSKHHYHLTLV
tara:strand:- start:194 stop:352 length:159 start_codon:yes stop_codon:yes gene_type:complete